MNIRSEREKVPGCCIRVCRHATEVKHCSWLNSYGWICASFPASHNASSYYESLLSFGYLALIGVHFLGNDVFIYLSCATWMQMRRHLQHLLQHQPTYQGIENMTNTIASQLLLQVRVHYVSELMRLVCVRSPITTFRHIHTLQDPQIRVKRNHDLMCAHSLWLIAFQGIHTVGLLQALRLQRIEYISVFVQGDLEGALRLLQHPGRTRPSAQEPQKPFRAALAGLIRHQQW